MASWTAKDHPTWVAQDFDMGDGKSVANWLRSVATQIEQGEVEYCSYAVRVTGVRLRRKQPVAKLTALQKAQNTLSKCHQTIADYKSRDHLTVEYRARIVEEVEKRARKAEARIASIKYHHDCQERRRRFKENCFKAAP